MNIGARGWDTPHTRRFRGQPKKTLRTVDGPLLRVVVKAYHLHVFFSLANLNIDRSLKHSNARCRNAELSTRSSCSCRQPRLTDRNTEPSSPSRPPAPERPNTNRSLNIQTDKDVKEPNSAPARCVLCAQGARRGACFKTHQHALDWINPVKAKIMQTPNKMFYLCLLLGAGHYS